MKDTVQQEKSGGGVIPSPGLVRVLRDYALVLSLVRDPAAAATLLLVLQGRKDVREWTHAGRANADLWMREIRDTIRRGGISLEPSRFFVAVQSADSVVEVRD